MPADIIPARVTLRGSQITLELEYDAGDQLEPAFQTGLSLPTSYYGGGAYSEGTYAAETGAFQWDAFQGAMQIVNLTSSLATAV